MTLVKKLNTVVAFVENAESSDNSERISQLLPRVLAQHQATEVSLRDLFEELGDEAFGTTILICALPNALPVPLIGISAFVGVSLMLVSGQLVLGFDKPWLPDWIVDQPLKKEHCEMVISSAIPFIEQLEKVIEPRWTFFTSPEAQRGVGIILFFLSLIIALPIPFGNMLPAIVIVLICLGLIEKDGLAIAISGMITGISPALLLLVL